MGKPVSRPMETERQRGAIPAAAFCRLDTNPMSPATDNLKDRADASAEARQPWILELAQRSLYLRPGVMNNGGKGAPVFLTFFCDGSLYCTNLSVCLFSLAFRKATRSSREAFEPGNTYPVAETVAEPCKLMVPDPWNDSDIPPKLWKSFFP